MFDNPTPNSGLADQLPAEAYAHLIRTLRVALPAPPGGSPEDFTRRDHAAIARIAALVPANAAEADLAAQFVAASEQWKDCLRLAQLPETTQEGGAKCRAEALRMMRHMNSALRLLLSLQQAREKREATNAGCDRAAWTEHCAIGLMAEALSHHPHPDPLGATPQNRADFAGTPAEGEGEATTAFPLPLGEGGAGEGSAGEAGGIARGGQGEGPTPAPQPGEAEPSEAPAKRVPICQQIGVPSGADPACPETQCEPAPACPVLRHGDTDPAAAEAEQYAIIYPERAALIRRLGRVPADASFGPPDDDLVRALVTGRTPALAALDLACPEPCRVR